MNSHLSILVQSDGYSIKHTKYPSKAEAQKEMRKAYEEYNQNDPGDEWDEMSFLGDTDAILYDCGENVYLWSIIDCY